MSDPLCLEKKGKKYNITLTTIPFSVDKFFPLDEDRLQKKKRFADKYMKKHKTTLL
jgi:hypothetical protein